MYILQGVADLEPTLRVLNKRYQPSLLWRILGLCKSELDYLEDVDLSSNWEGEECALGGKTSEPGYHVPVGFRPGRPC